MVSLPTVFSPIVCIGSPSGEKNFRDLVTESEIIMLPSDRYRMLWDS